MELEEDGRGFVEKSQALLHGDGHDYTVGSPHLRHQLLRARIDDRIRSCVTEFVRRTGHCRVLEIGAGHGSFTQTVLEAGGSAIVTEMSTASFDHLRSVFGENADVKVVYDVDGEAPFRENGQHDLILLISVIHHIPDYMDVITRLCDQLLAPGGAIITFQDPVWYPRQKRWDRALSQGCYFAWRITQGELRRGLATRFRRLRGVYSESEPSDLVEYHVVRHGVNDVALAEALRDRFQNVEVEYYFSTQSPQLQRVLRSMAPPNTFGIWAKGHRKK